MEKVIIRQMVCTKSLLSALENVTSTQLSKHALIAVSNRTDFSLKTNSNDAGVIKEILNKPINKEITEENKLFLGRALMLLGKRYVDRKAQEKMEDLLSLAQSSSAKNNCHLATLFVDSIFELYPIVTNSSKLFLRDKLKLLGNPTLSSSQEVELSCHEQNFDFANDYIKRFSSQSEKGVIVRNLLTLPGEESLCAQVPRGTFAAQFSRRCLRKIVTSFIAHSESRNLDSARRYLKIISPLDDLTAAAAGFAVLGDVQSVQNLIRTEGPSLFSDKQPVIKLTFDLCTALELFLSGYKKEAVKYLSNETSISSNNKVVLNEDSQIVADSILTYCIVNNHDEMATYLLKNFTISPWRHAAFPVAIKNRDYFPNKNWHLFCSQFRRPSVRERFPIHPRDPERVNKKERNFKHLIASR